jgi:phage baseplate assembly protein W
MAFYKDIDLTFEKNIQNDFNVIYNEQAIQQSLKNIILPKRRTYNRFQKPTIGTNIERLLGEKLSNFIALQLEDEITVAISNFEPRVRLLNIETTLGVDIGTYELKITYKLVSTNIVSVLELNLNVII